MTKEQKITYGLIALLGIGVIVLLVVLFSGKKDTNQDLYDQLIAAKDSVIAEKNLRIIEKQSHIEELKNDYQQLEQRDSILNVRFLETEQTYKKINETIRNIPVRINRIATNNDSLRLLLSEY